MRPTFDPRYPQTGPTIHHRPTLAEQIVEKSKQPPATPSKEQSKRQWRPGPEAQMH